MLGQLQRIALATHDVLDDLQPRLAHDVRYHFRQLDIHLFQRLLQVLHVLGRVTDQHLTLPLKATPTHDLVRRPKRRRQQAVAVQTPNPLAIQHVALGPARRVLGLTRIHQDHVETPAGQQIVQRNPVTPRSIPWPPWSRRTPSARPPTASRSGVVAPNFRTPSGSWGVGIDEARRHVLRRHRHEVHRRMHVDPRRVPLRDRQLRHRRRRAKRFPERGVMTLPSLIKNAWGEKMPRARECVIRNRLPNGDSRRSRDGATNEVIASSRDQAQQRVENTSD